MKKLAYILILLASVGFNAHAQVRPGNLNSFDDRMLHWGIQVGYTQSKFDLHYTPEDSIRQTILGTTSYYSPGFHINVIGDLKLNDFLNLRLLPGVTLVSRDMAYRWSDAYTSTHWKYDTQRTVESVYAEMPIELKVRAKRYGNFRPYLLGGGYVGRDVASLFKNQNNNDESIIRLKPIDIRYTMGVGFSFFLPYVKLAVELKMSFGLIDLRVDDNDLYTLSTTDMRSRTFMLSFTFE
ncbi:MAG: PorT family protein [Bacteroidales bacterium]|nr:PorT family protein [Bacteroidales bacterium]